MLDKSQLVRVSLFVVILASLGACSGASQESEGDGNDEQGLSQDDNSSDKRQILASDPDGGFAPEDDAGSWHETDGGYSGDDGGFHSNDAGFGGRADGGAWHYGDGGSPAYDAGRKR